MERRGAEVVAIDRWDNPRFHEMRATLQLRADYRLMDVYEINPRRLGRFDIVLSWARWTVVFGGQRPEAVGIIGG
jgi:hypothetical protein